MSIYKLKKSRIRKDTVKKKKNFTFYDSFESDSSMMDDQDESYSP